MGKISEVDTKLSITDVFSSNSESDAKYDDVTIIDKYWVKSRFMVSDDSLGKDDKKSRYASSADSKFTDTTLGGNISMNPKPQFTSYCDIRPPKLLNRNKVSLLGSSNLGIGMGRYYSEAIDDNQHVIFMQFGVAKFNSLTDFFFRAIDYETSVIANTGRSTIAYTIGQIVGGGIMMAAFPLMTMIIWGLKLGAKLLAGHGSFNYYYMEPTMHTYWSTVNQLVSSLAVELGILMPYLEPSKASEDRTNNKTNVGVPFKISKEQLDQFRDLLPGLISDNNYIDVFAISTRAQTIVNRRNAAELKILEDPNLKFDDYNTGVMNKKLSDVGLLAKVDRFFTFEQYLGVTVDGGIFKDKGDETPPAKLTTSNTDGKKTLTPEEKAKLQEAINDKSNRFTKNKDGTVSIKGDSNRASYMRRFVSAVDSSVRQGGAFASFSIEYKGSVTETFSNSVGRIDTGEKAKAIARKSKNLKFDYAGGNIAMGMDQAMGYVKDLAAGALDSVSFGLSSVLQTAFGGGYIDIPKKWEDSSAYFPTQTYTMKLISPYGNTISQLQNIYIPLSMILAGTLPLNTGGSSYTSPFLCSVFNKGIQNMQLGMITSLSITRGTSNLGFDKKRRPLAIDVSFTITDFSTMVTSPLNTSIFSDLFNVNLDDDTPIGRYITVLGGRDLLHNTYKTQKIQLNMSKLAAKLGQRTSPSGYGMIAGSILEGVLGGVVARRTLTGSFNN